MVSGDGAVTVAGGFILGTLCMVKSKCSMLVAGT